MGDEVNVKVLSVDEKGGKISLSIRATEEAPAPQAKPAAQKKLAVHLAVKQATEEPHQQVLTLLKTN